MPTCSTWALFVVSVHEDRSEVAVFDGAVELSNDVATTNVVAGFEGIAIPGQPLVVRPMIEARNIIQWFLYYPGVLDVAELAFTEDERVRLSESLKAYATGDLLAALELHPDDPADATRGSASASVYHAGLLLAVGQVERAETLLAPLDGYRPAQALQTLIAAVRLDPDSEIQSALSVAAMEPPSSSLYLAISYWHQSRHDLPAALRSARLAVAAAPDFGFAWVRVAELEFGFGRNRSAEHAARRALELSPRNAQAHALEGFLLAGRGRVEAASEAFERAIELDSGLGNAWLGRGLCKIRNGDLTEGTADLRTASVLEPNRALLRSYLGKALAELELDAQATEELRYAARLDPNDPTSWLYSALLRFHQNRLNQALRDLEESVARNDNRRVYRSQMLLDQDRAVRMAWQAKVYRDLGLSSVSLTEAARAVASDPVGADAYRFLADSYDALRDPLQVNLRYESAWLNSWLLANLLGPVGSTSISTFASQQEYSDLFERDRARFFSRAEARTDGQQRVAGSGYGSFGSTGYAVDAVYFAQDGTRPNEDLEMQTVSVQLKQQLTGQDAVFLQVYGYDAESGDVRQYWDPAEAQGYLRFRERQEPTAWLGYHREWSPGQHTLFLGGLLDSRIEVENAVAGLLRLWTQPDGSLRVDPVAYWLEDYSSDLEAYSVELQHRWQTHPHTVIVGGRYQTGTTRTESSLVPVSGLGLTVRQQADADLGRASGYAYYQLQVAEPLFLIAGVSYERVEYPRNIDNPPIADGEATRDQLSPKAGFIWTPQPGTVVRGAYTRSLGGIYYDSSVRLEPTQLAGFVQTFRSAIPESVAGTVPGARFETAGLGVTQRLGRSTYLNVTAEHLGSTGDQGVGALMIEAMGYGPTTLWKELRYRENTLQAAVHQLLGDLWVAGVNYRISQAKLEETGPGWSLPASLDDSGTTSATWQQIGLSLRLNHPSGWFALAESFWNHQDWKSALRSGTATGSDRFWQHNLLVGYRWAQRRAELSLGVMNLSDEDYRLHPLNLHPNYPRGRALLVSAKVDF